MYTNKVVTRNGNMIDWLIDHASLHQFGSDGNAGLQTVD